MQTQVASPKVVVRSKNPHFEWSSISQNDFNYEWKNNIFLFHFETWLSQRLSSHHENNENGENKFV